MRNLSSSLTPQSSRNAELFSMSPRKFLTLSCRELGFRFSYSPQLPQYQLQRCVVPSNTPGPAGRPEPLPFWWRSQGGRKLYSKLVYGAASVSSGEARVFLFCGVYGTQGGYHAACLREPYRLAVRQGVSILRGIPLSTLGQAAVQRYRP